jgi:predicted small secreted protein
MKCPIPCYIEGSWTHSVNGYLMKYTQLSLYSLLVMTLSLSACADLKHAGRTIGHASKEVATDVGHAARDTTKAIGHASRDAVKSVKEDLSDKD